MYSSSQKLKLRSVMTAYMVGSFANEARIHYTQHRPFGFYTDLSRVRYAYLDCSAYVCNVYWNAMHDTGLYLHDPLDERYTGLGYTGTEELWLREAGKRITTQGYLVGDIVRAGYGEHAHTYMCWKRGSAKTARFASHGQEAGPLDVALNYRDDVIGVWRHPGLL